MNRKVQTALEKALIDWDMMQKTNDEDSEEVAERFEKHFYEFIDEVKEWYQSLQLKPQDIIEAEEMAEVIIIQGQLPGPLQLNFLTELEFIIEGIERTRFD
ncbi:hypothetical protein [Alkalihalobacillus sp. LMS39]|uniref:hypothetical protein n=1 Tax=Alkalihalobacillus sp. LMS39 TaxID=2924032 RepID=UPI001FB30412|nr:hypothetical protein [Alkalihalobacillus sp. LMS39]UOE92008.1 hypothetical protein MM271_12075 [Alkalihalobacillus sp. LMS39]